MAAPIPVTTTLYDSHDFVVVKITIPTGGDVDLTAARVLNLSNYTTDRAPTRLSISKVLARLSGFTAILLQDATTDVHMLSITDGMNEDYADFPILMTGAAGTTGDLLLATSGISTTDHGHIILVCKKKMS